MQREQRPLRWLGSVACTASRKRKKKRKKGEQTTQPLSEQPNRTGLDADLGRRSICGLELRQLRERLCPSAKLPVSERLDLSGAERFEGVVGPLGQA